MKPSPHIHVTHTHIPHSFKRCHLSASVTKVNIYSDSSQKRDRAEKSHCQKRKNERKEESRSAVHFMLDQCSREEEKGTGKRNDDCWTHTITSWSYKEQQACCVCVCVCLCVCERERTSTRCSHFHLQSCQCIITVVVVVVVVCVCVVQFSHTDIYLPFTTDSKENENISVEHRYTQTLVKGSVHQIYKEAFSHFCWLRLSVIHLYSEDGCISWWFQK